ncbi:MAG: FadR/GntR family transcriptional regulator [Ancrocorticia sp.]|uniref:FadR/GntR family transcriptional regulator n=1 Tax=Ancrocorticia sp. TaxID=2593684 RepID=UPI003F91ACAA
MKEPTGPLLREDHRGLSHAVAVRLKSDIAIGKLAPGDKVPSEAELGRSYEVSRTVVREAVSQLRAEGLVETYQGRGTFIAAASVPHNDADVHGLSIDLSVSRSAEDIMELRLGIEPHAAFLASKRYRVADLASLDRALMDFEEAVAHGASTISADFAIHRSIAVASSNPLIIAIISALGSQAVLLQRASIHEGTNVLAPEHGDLLRHEHRQIRNAIARRDSDGARAAMITHLTRSMSAL